MGERHYYFFHFSYSCWVNTRWSRIMFSFEMHQKSCNQAELHCQILFQLETTKILENKCTPRHASQWQNRAYGIFKQQWSLNTHSDWMSAEKKKAKKFSVTEKTAWKWKLTSSLTQTSNTETSESRKREVHPPKHIHKQVWKAQG